MPSEEKVFISGSKNVSFAFKDEFLDNIAQDAPVMIWVNDPSRNCIYVNNTWLAFTGRKFSEELGKGWMGSLHPEDKRRTLKEIKTAFNNRRPFVTEYRVKRHDGIYRWLLDSGIPHYSKNNKFIGFIGSCIDITDRKEIEAKLAMSEKRFRTLMEQSPLSIQLFSSDGQLEKVNKAWEKMWGTTLSKIKGYNILKDNQLIDRGVMPFIKKAFKGETITIPPHMYEPDKTIKGVTDVKLRWIQSWMYPIKNESGQIKEVCLVHQDITEQKLIEERMILHASIAQSLSDAVIATDNDYRITSWNKAAEELYKWKAVEVIGKRAKDIVPTHFTYGSRKDWEHNMDRYGRWSGEIVQTTRDKRKVYILSSTSVIKNLQGQIVGRVAINKDITIRKTIERLLKDSEEKFRRLVDANILGVIQVKLDGEVIEANKVFMELLGFTNRDLLKREINWIELISQDNKKTLRELILNVKKEGTAGPVNLEFVRKDKTTLPMLLGISLLDKKTKRAIAFCIDMSKQQKAESDLLDAKRQLEVILQNIADGITVQDSSGRVIFANEVAAKASGFESAKSMMNADRETFIQKIERFEIRNEMGEEISLSELPGRKALSGEASPEAVVQFYDKNSNTSHWSLVKARAIYDNSNKVTHAVNIITDMTDRMQLELSLRYLVEASEILSSSLDYKQNLQNIAHLAVPTIADWCAVDMMEDGKLVTVAIVHKDKDKITMAKKYRQENPVDLNVDYGTAKVLKTGKPEFYPVITKEMLEKSAKTKEQLNLMLKIGFTSSLTVPLKVRNKVVGVISLITAESQRRLTELDLYMTEQLASRASSALENSLLYRDVNNERRRINDLVSNVPGIVWEAWGKPDESKQRIDFVSSYVEKMLGYSVNEWINTPNFWLTVVHPEDKKRAAKESAYIFKNGKTGTSRFRWIAKNGKTIWVEAQSYVIKDEKGNPVGMRGVTMDISERMEIERRKDEFISIASHELRTPITSIKVFTQILENMFKDHKGDGSFQYLKKMESQINRLENLVGDLLDVSRIQSGRITFERRNFSLNKLIRETLSLMSETNKDREFEFEDKGNIKIIGDKERISQVLVNILSNAAKYSPPKSKIKVAIKTTADEAVVSISDKGVGIAKEHQSKIFDRFYRVFDDRDRTFPGLGMGLYISKEIVSRHGGRIWLKSRFGKGSTFYFSLPCKLNV